MRGRRPVGPEYAEQLDGSETAKLRTKVILETIAGTCRVKEACQRLGVCEQRFHQLRQEMLMAAVQLLIITALLAARSVLFRGPVSTGKG